MTQALVQRVVPFEGDELIGVQNDDSTIYAVFVRICDNLTLTREGQVRRVRSHEVLSAGFVTLTVETKGGPQQMQCIRLSLVPLWLTTIQANRIKDAGVREKLVRYQQEAAEVLWQPFRGQIIVEPGSDELPTSTDTELAQLQQIVELGRAIMRMAEEQIEQRRRMDVAARVVKGMRTELTDVQVRLGVLEEQVTPSGYIGDTQAADVSSRVKALAELLTIRDPSKNHYQGIYSELYRRFNVSGYKLIRREQFAGVIAFLDEWRAAGARAV